mmetsp:Transcript_20243/g.36100  ORF Transcript_20243/g.36100 Transcript_20243/m.36100 type:complete len:112 (+) Transcript_20243:370-705(+)
MWQACLGDHDYPNEGSSPGRDFVDADETSMTTVLLVLSWQRLHSSASWTVLVLALMHCAPCLCPSECNPHLAVKLAVMLPETLRHFVEEEEPLTVEPAEIPPDSTPLGSYC